MNGKLVVVPRCVACVVKLEVVPDTIFQMCIVGSGCCVWLHQK